MNRKIGIIGTLLAAMTLMAVFAVVPAWAADPTNATTSAGSTETYSSGDTIGSASANGGSITEVTVTVASQTTKWQGFYGNVNGGIQLANSSGGQMYDWSSTVAGEVYASQNDSIFDTADWADLTNQTGASIDDNWSFIPGDADSATNTFTVTSSEIVVGSKTITAAEKSAVKTNAQNGTAVWETIALGTNGTAKTDFTFVGVINNNEIAYDGTVKDYQMIVPVGGSTETYYFYVELT